MPEEYYKEIEVSSFRGTIIFLLTFLVVVAVMVMPFYYSIDGYTQTIVVKEKSMPMILDENNTEVSGTDMAFNETEQMIYALNNRPTGKVTIHGINLTAGKGILFNLTFMRIGAGDFRIVFYNDTYLTETLIIDISIIDYGQTSTVDMEVNGFTYPTQNLDIVKFRENPWVEIFQYNGTYIVSILNVQYVINKDTINNGTALALVNSTSVSVSGSFLYYFAITGIQEENVAVKTMHTPMVKNTTYLIYSVLVAVAVVIGIYYFREYFVELSLLLIIAEVILLNMALNMTMDIAYMVSISLALATLTISFLAVDYEPIIDIDRFVERHLWRITVMWMVVVIFFVVYKYLI